MNLSDIIPHLKKVKKSGKGYSACCPVHDDHTPSLSISEENGKILVKCLAGCDQKVVFDTVCALAGEKPSQHTNTNTYYEYQDEHGTALYRSVRQHNPKKFFQQRWDAQQGEFVPGLADVRRVPYNLPGLLKAIAAGEAVYLVEGEKDVDTLRAHGLPATTTGSATSWKALYAPFFAGATVIILPDNDKEGDEYAEKVRHGLITVVNSLQVVLLPGLPEHGDVTDWLNAGHTLTDLHAEIAKVTPATKPTPTHKTDTGPFRIAAKKARDLQQEDISPAQPIIENMLYPGFALFAGRVGIGKTWMLLHMADAVTRGGYVFGNTPVARSGVLYVALESGRAKLQERLDVINKGELSDDYLEYLTVEDGFPGLHDGGIDAIDIYLETNPHVRMVILDSITSIMPKSNGRGNQYQTEYQSLKPLYDIGIRRNVCIVGAWHTNKAESDDPMQCFNGTTGLAAVAGGGRIVLKRGRYNVDAELHTMPRDGETKKIALKWDSVLCSWTAIDDVIDQLPKGDAQRSILKVLDGNGPMNARDITTKIYGNMTNYQKVRQRLFQMEAVGDVKKVGRGLYEYRSNNNIPINNHNRNNRNNETEPLDNPADCYDEPDLLQPNVTGNSASGSLETPIVTIVTDVYRNTYRGPTGDVNDPDAVAGVAALHKYKEKIGVN